MSKSSVFDFVGLFAAMLEDVAAYFPNDRVEWSRDLSRITRLSLERGQPFFTIDLPALGKQLDRSLAGCRLDLTGLNHSGSRKPGSKIPRLFWGLWSRLFNDDGGLKQDVDPNSVFFLRTLLYVGKNLEVECAPKYLYETIKEFYDVESQISPPSQIWEDGFIPSDDHDFGSLLDFLDHREGDLDLSESGHSGVEGFLLHDIQRFADAVARDIGSISPESLRFRHGPGAVSDKKRGQYKYDLTNWTDRLELIFPYDSFGTIASESLKVDPSVGFGNVSFKEMASKLIGVPKTQKGPRLIAAEPTAHQWVQQGIADYLHSYTKRRGSLLGDSISFTEQELSGELALSGSRTGHLATVDLKSASDRLSANVVQRIFRRNKSLLAMFTACRTRFIRNEIDAKSPALLKLRKFSTQGSALTFPVQSIVFACVAVGVGISLHPRSSWRALCRQVRVFGDDIIVPRLWEPRLRKALTLLGLRVNDTKTFAEGNFRESCGVDAWMGYDVTPPHVIHPADKTNPRVTLSCVAVSNNFHMKGMWRAAQHLRSTAGPRLTPVIGFNSGIFGFKSFTKGAIEAKNRFNRHTHEWEVRAFQIIGKNRTTKQETSGMLLQFFTVFGEGVESTRRAIVDYTSGVTVGCDPCERVSWVPVRQLAIS